MHFIVLYFKSIDGKVVGLLTIRASTSTASHGQDEN